MITLTSGLPIFIYHLPVNMNKSIDGLSQLVVEAMALNPQDKAVYLFHNRARDKFKALLWDGDGFMLLYKRRERGRFCFPKDLDGCYQVDADLFIWLRRGFDFYAIAHQPELTISDYY